ncbi:MULTISPECIES: DUF1822 family protein [unclassified Coleofasciculus]|uniref:DUF1822 family protein n=1 Tax=unclassified Coleofasciculus TaxID=2692782 RepID=UPI00187EBCEC|nr:MULTISPECIES: DUF1822 family protein [unclassified Coleofasciculus]MBE9128555.1 DUF1822 family protein [Coleofasciculus sp. LEGE 07081]MBE9149365.1 DUF1822 family protein [Coleofasciculus sp. LEGE 07092]
MTINQKKGRVIIFETSSEELEQLQALFESGELSRVLGIQVSDIGAIAESNPTAPVSIGVQLRQWFQQNVLDKWEAEATLIGTFLAQEMNDTSSWRQELEGVRGGSRSGVIRRYIELLDNPDKQVSFQAALELGETGNPDPAIIQALVKGLQTCHHEETSWQIALSLGELEPSHSQAAFAQHKTIELAGQAVELLVGVKRNSEQQIDVVLQVYSTELEDTLPEGLELTVLDELGQIWRKMTAQAGDYYSQVGLTIPLGKGFTVELGLGDVRVRESFVV